MATTRAANDAREHAIAMVMDIMNKTRTQACIYLDEYHSKCYTKHASCPWMPPTQNGVESHPAAFVKVEGVLRLTNPSNGPSPLSFEDELCAIHHVADASLSQVAPFVLPPPVVSPPKPPALSAAAAALLSTEIV